MTKPDPVPLPDYATVDAALQRWPHLEYAQNKAGKRFKTKIPVTIMEEELAKQKTKDPNYKPDNSHHLKRDQHFYVIH